MGRLQMDTILMIGATSGIGQAMAEEFLRRGKRVIVTGRRQANLDSFVSKHGTDRCKGVQMDITDFASIPAKIEACMNAFDGAAVDSVYVGSGIQRPGDFSKPESIDMDALEMEIKTNYVAYLHIAKAVLPYLFKQDRPTNFMAVTSGLALVPITPCPDYCSTKAALHHWLMVLRKQLEHTQVRVIEILPPLVESELHDKKHQPHLAFDEMKERPKAEMPLKDFIAETFAGLDEGKLDIPVGGAKDDWAAWEPERFRRYAQRA